MALSDRRLRIGQSRERSYGPVVLLAADLKDLSAALWACALLGWLAVLHRDLLRVLHLDLSLAFHTICFDHYTASSERANFIGKR